MNFTHSQAENEANVINSIQKFVIEAMNAMREGRSFIFSATVNDKISKDFAMTFGDPEGISSIREAFKNNNKNILDAIDKVFPEDKPPKGKIVKIDKKEDGGIIINLSK